MPQSDLTLRLLILAAVANSPSAASTVCMRTLLPLLQCGSGISGEDMYILKIGGGGTGELQMQKLVEGRGKRENMHMHILYMSQDNPKITRNKFIYFGNQSGKC